MPWDSISRNAPGSHEDPFSIRAAKAANKLLETSASASITPPHRPNRALGWIGRQSRVRIPCPGGLASCRSSTSAPACRASKAVESVQLSAITNIRNRSSGQSILRRLQIVRSMTLVSLCAGTMTSNLSVLERRAHGFESLAKIPSKSIGKRRRSTRGWRSRATKRMWRKSLAITHILGSANPKKSTACPDWPQP